MEMSSFRPESHVAQQSRRDKLRVQQQNSTSSQHLEEFPNSLDHLSVHQELNPDLIQVRNVRNGNVLYDPIVLSSDMLNFSSNSQVFLGSKDAIVGQDSNAVSEDASFPNLPHPISSKAAGDPQNCVNWKSLGSQQSCDWIVNYGSGTVGSHSNQNPMYVGEVLSASSMKVNNISASSLDLKPNYSGYQDVQSSITNPSSEISSQDSQKHYGEIHFNSPQLYRNTLQEVVTSAAIGTQGLELASFAHHNIRDSGRDSWEDGGSELLLLPNFGNHSSTLRLDSPVAWMTRPVEGCHQWGGGDLGVLANKSLGDLSTIASDSNAQGLSLSLSSNPSSKIQVAQFGERFESKDLRSGTATFSCPQDLKVTSSGYLCSDSKLPVSSKGYGNSLHDVVGTSTYRSAGPLGPFTGYATILKSSKFMKPAQLLLDEFCKSASPKAAKTCEVTQRASGDASVSIANVIHASETEVGAAKGGNSTLSSSTFYDANEISGEGAVKSSSGESFRPEYQQKKAKLLFMQEEVCRRYKQYHQQMQMVVSSFESVAGLNAATPYISLALKTVSRHFRFLKNAISDQLRTIRKALGEDLSSPSTGACTSAGDASSPRLKFLNQSFPKHKPGGTGANLGFLEPQQHVWRPQRGLPERAVAVLRAWLFEHFLHPYPTDTDKHMLATQTGLSRNQVSNWFINARVRVWKPMVEEVHMLETKGLAENDQNSGKKDWKPRSEGVSSQRDGNQPSNKLISSVNAMSDEQLESRGMCSSAGTGDEHWNQEKRSRVDCQIPGTMDGSLMGFVPYQRSGVGVGVEMGGGGLGAVSLTLGLRHSVETAQQQQQQQQLQQQEDQLRRQFGGQMIHDFVG